MSWACHHRGLKVTVSATAVHLPPAQLTMSQPSRTLHPLGKTPPGTQFFTFDPLPKTPGAKQSVPSQTRGRKRCRKVLYPPVVRRYLPAEEKCHGQRLLVLLLGIIFFQVYSATENQEDALPTLVPCSVPGTGAQQYPPVEERLGHPEDYWQREDLSVNSLALGQPPTLASKSECFGSLDITGLLQGRP
ncbi:radiation-inducible immediate-early gene IEX-1 [Microcaecilia unicolor]|uniref:Radiation-inducible immediate-early gene IEX-1 n=1 Tax=Microcaecilia unicolor TaxID=1415580 RepID=A0A6P7XCI4_9AMPH|nr:radiation-inducible immediate-early gene IEX-1 [Microcaecilia unicolor]